MTLCGQNYAPGWYASIRGQIWVSQVFTKLVALSSMSSATANVPRIRHQNRRRLEALRPRLHAPLLARRTDKSALQGPAAAFLT